MQEVARTEGESRSSLASGLLCALIRGGVACSPGYNAQSQGARTYDSSFVGEHCAFSETMLIPVSATKKRIIYFLNYSMIRSMHL